MHKHKGEKQRTRKRREKRITIRSEVVVAGNEFNDSESDDYLPSLNPRDTDLSSVTENPKGRQQPDDNADDHNHVQDVLYLSVHRDVGIDQPEQDTDDDECDGERNQSHGLPPVSKNC